MSAMNTERQVVLALALCLLSCGHRRLSFKGCTDDSQCSEGQVCFADGCGDPTRGIAVEIQANPAQGQFAQDIAIPQVRQNQNFELAPPATLQVDLSRAGQPFNDGIVSFSGVGESAIIPGIARNFHSSLSSPSGSFALFLATGRYTLTVTANDPTIPPSVAQIPSISPGESVPINLTFPAEGELFQITGGVVRSVTPRTPLDSAIPMEIQVLDESTRVSLSQRFSIPPNSPDGNFGTIFADPSAGAGTRYALRISPQDSRALAPEKTFLLPVSSHDNLVLELGNYGQPTSFTGRAISSNETPVPNAAVFVKGRVTGGGTFRSSSVRTAPDGTFSLVTLPPASGGTLTLWIVPPNESKSGLLTTGLSSSQLHEFHTYRLQDRASAQGVVHRPDGSEAAGVRVIATPAQSPDSAPLTMSMSQAITDQRGNYVLSLDPGLYRLDFIPREGLPRSSRFLDVPADSAGQQVELEVLLLSRPRTVTGTVSLPRQAVASYASVRFFRVVYIGDSLRSIPLAETVTNSLDGSYSVVLPTR